MLYLIHCVHPSMTSLTIGSIVLKTMKAQSQDRAQKASTSSTQHGASFELMCCDCIGDVTRDQHGGAENAFSSDQHGETG